MDSKWKLRWSNDVNQDKNDFDGSNPTAEMPKISFPCGLDKKSSKHAGLLDFSFLPFSDFTPKAHFLR